MDLIMLNVLVKRLHPDVKLPTKGSVEAACFDLTVGKTVRTPEGWTVHTGLAVAIPYGHAILVYPRSGLSTKLGLSLRNGTGIIDSDYRGEIVLKFNAGAAYLLEDILKALVPGSRVAQAMVIQLPEVCLQEVSELPTSIRGDGGFGSTGV
jgi:dUTP pyrophosphatase